MNARNSKMVGTGAVLALGVAWLATAAPASAQTHGRARGNVAAHTTSRPSCASDSLHLSYNSPRVHASYTRVDPGRGRSPEVHRSVHWRSNPPTHQSVRWSAPAPQYTVHRRNSPYGSATTVTRQCSPDWRQRQWDRPATCVTYTAPSRTVVYDRPTYSTPVYSTPACTTRVSTGGYYEPAVRYPERTVYVEPARQVRYVRPAPPMRRVETVRYYEPSCAPRRTVVHTQVARPVHKPVHHYRVHRDRVHRERPWNVGVSVGWSGSRCSDGHRSSGWHVGGYYGRSGRGDDRHSHGGIRIRYRD